VTLYPRSGGTHTVKFGGYYEFVINNQPNSTSSNGTFIEAGWAGGQQWVIPTRTCSLASPVSTRRRTSANLHNEGYNTIEFFGMDSWRVDQAPNRGVRACVRRISERGTTGKGLALPFGTLPFTPARWAVALISTSRIVVWPLSGFANRGALLCSSLQLGLRPVRDGKDCVAWGLGTVLLS